MTGDSLCDNPVFLNTDIPTRRRFLQKEGRGLMDGTNAGFSGKVAKRQSVVRSMSVPNSLLSVGDRKKSSPLFSFLTNGSTKEQQEDDDVLIPSCEGSVSSRRTSDNFSLINHSLGELSIGSDQSGSCHPALQVPEILNLILEYVDSLNVIPHESTPKRRKPMSLQHALLLHGDSSATRQEWHRSQSESRKNSVLTTNLNRGGGIYSCLFVNKFWYAVAVRILYKQLHFKKESSWNRFMSNSKPVDNSRPSVFVLHKLPNVQQCDLHQLEKFGGAIEWLEFYTCPNIVPTRSLLNGGRMTKVVLPGCGRVDDKTIALVAQMCPGLEHLDIRACDKVSDKGLKFIAKHCRQLKLLNVGRTQNGDLITHRGLKHIARRTQLVTLGAAGTAIEDRTMWDFAAYRGKSLERLSLNNCKLLTNKSVPRILNHTPTLSVLELRGCTQITEMRPIVKFKRMRERLGRTPLIEGCELFELRMKEAEWLIEMEVSREVFRDCLEWIYAEDDDQNVYRQGLATSSSSLTIECSDDPSVH